jgi:hypothetical protein
MHRFDIINAFIMGSKPWYQDELDNPALYPDLKDLKPSTKEIGAQYLIRLSNLTGLQDLSQETIKVYGLLYHLITKKERAAALWSNGVTDAEHQSFQLYSFRIMYRLIALVQYEFTSSSRNTLIYGLFGNAGMAHLFMFTFNVLPRIGDAILISKRIRTSLEIINMQRFQIAYPEMIIWVVMIGGMASIGAGDEDTKWFIKLLAELCRATGVATRDELAQYLATFLWSDFYFLCDLFRKFWDDFANEITGGVEGLD